jgi:hypothetical protein
VLGFGYKLRWIARRCRFSEEGESEPGKELVFDYLRLSHMIGDGSLLLTRVEEREKERESMTLVIVCTECWQDTKYEAFSLVSGKPCDKCGELL